VMKGDRRERRGKSKGLIGGSSGGPYGR